MTPKKICAEHEIAVKPGVETLDSAEWRLNELGTGEKNMTPTQIRKVADYLDHVCGEINAAQELRDRAQLLERDAQAEQIVRRALERMDVPVTVNAGQLAQALHWVEDHRWLSDKPIPQSVLELMRVIANVHAELLEGVA